MVVVGAVEVGVVFKQQDCSRQASAVIQVKLNLLNFGAMFVQHLTVHVPWSQLKNFEQLSGMGFLNAIQ